MLFAREWVELEIVMLSKISQTWKDKYCVRSLIFFLKIEKKDMKVEVGYLRIGRETKGRSHKARHWGTMIKVRHLCV
jgi:hypothetical protein